MIEVSQALGVRDRDEKCIWRPTLMQLTWMISEKKKKKQMRARRNQQAVRSDRVDIIISHKISLGCSAVKHRWFGKPSEFYNLD